MWSGGHLMALASPPCWWTSDGTAGLEKDQMLLRRIYSLQIWIKDLIHQKCLRKMCSERHLPLNWIPRCFDWWHQIMLVFEEKKKFDKDIPHRKILWATNRWWWMNLASEGAISGRWALVTGQQCSGGLCMVCYTKYKIQIYNTNTGGGLCIAFYTKYNNTMQIQGEWSTVEDTQRGTRHSLLIVVIVNIGQGPLSSASGFSELSWMVSENMNYLFHRLIVSLQISASEAKRLRRSAI